MTSWFEAQGILDKVRQLLAERSCEGYVVGGYVRDQLLGRATRDLDLAVRHEPAELARQVANRLGGAFVPLGVQHQMARVVLRDRAQLFYIDFTRLRGDCLESDLAARDFTINAMAADVQDTDPQPLVIDPHGGRQDLEKELIRAVSDSVFQDDPLRLLRAVRLAAELGMQVESHTEELITRDYCLVIVSSEERARDELCKTIGTKRAAPSLRYLDRLGMLTLLVPEVKPLHGLEQPLPHRQDAFEHSLATVQALETLREALLLMVGGDRASSVADTVPGEDLWGYTGTVLSPFAALILNRLQEEVSNEHSRLMLLKLAALLHDVGKATTGRVDKGGRIRFFGHQREGSALAARALRRLRFSKGETRLVQTLIRHHMRPLQLAQEGEVTRRAIYRFFKDIGDAGVDVLVHSLADNLALWGAQLDANDWRKLLDTVALLMTKYYEEYDEVIVPPPLINGNDLIGRLGMKPGPAVGRLLQATQEAQAAGEVRTREEALLLAQTLLAEEEK